MQNEKILIVIVLLFFLPVCFVYAEPGGGKTRTQTKLDRRTKLDEFTKDIDITVGVVGIGSFFRITKDKQKDYPSFISPNVGGIMRMVKPIMTKNVNDLIANFYTTGELHIIVNS